MKGKFEKEKKPLGVWKVVAIVLLILLLLILTIVALIYGYYRSKINMLQEDTPVTDTLSVQDEIELNNDAQDYINEIQGAQPRVYFAYYPDQYKDLHNWLQLTIIFARPGSGSAPVIVPGSTPAPESADGVWLSQDNYNHLEIFASPTPEPDSAAME